MAKITSLENLKFGDENSSDEKITATEPEGAEVSTFVQFGTDVTGEIGSSDKKIPRLNIGQKSGALGDTLGYGSLLLNKEVVIAPYGQKVTDVSVLKIKKQYQERRPYDPNSTTMPRLFNSAREAFDAGFATEWGHNDDKMALPVANILFLVAAPTTMDKDSVEQNFFYEFGGKHYAAALFTTSPTGYNETAKPIFTALDTPKVREVGLRAVKWKIEPRKVQNAINSWYVLKINTDGYSSPEFVEYTRTILP
jgi:hypothetical protein